MHNDTFTWYLDATWLNQNELEVHFIDGFGHKQKVIKYKYGQSKCSCGMPQPCPHVRFLIQNQTEFLAGETKPTLEDVKSIAQKDLRRTDRIQKLQRAIEELQLWLEEILSRGLAAQIQENVAFAEILATRMADASLTSLTRRLTDLQKQTLQALSANQPIPIEWTQLTVLLQAGKQQNQLPELLWADLCQTLGISYRKEDIRILEDRLADLFIVVGIEKITVEPRLNQRTTWLFAQKQGTWHCFIEFEFEGRTYLPAALPLAFQFESTAWCYPSPLKRRIWFEEIPETPLAYLVNIITCTTLSEALEKHSAELKYIPWLTETPVLLEKMRLLFVSQSWYLLDQSGAALPVFAHEHHLMEQLYAKSLGAEMKIFGLVGRGGFRIV